MLIQRDMHEQEFNKALVMEMARTVRPSIQREHMLIHICGANPDFDRAFF